MSKNKKIERVRSPEYYEEKYGDLKTSDGRYMKDFIRGCNERGLFHTSQIELEEEKE